MIKIDLITGFLGSGKTTFLRKYASYLITQGQNIGILENDFGAVNVDMMLLGDLRGDNCELEMISGGCDADTHRRRFKTKLISMGMCGYDRVIVEPSGIYDVDEFFDTLHEEPLDGWYQIGNVITVLDSNLEENLPEGADFLLASQAANAGCIILSKTQETTEPDQKNAVDHLNRALEKIGCKRQFDKVFAKDWDKLTDEDFKKLLSCGYRMENYLKPDLTQEKTFQSLYFMNMHLTEVKLQEAAQKLFSDKSCGNVFRVKGFMKNEKEQWIELNATQKNLVISPIKMGQEVIIVIGEQLVEDAIRSYTGTVFVVSHDRYFINQVATGILEFGESDVQFYGMNYAQYLEEIKRQTPGRETGNAGGAVRKPADVPTLDDVFDKKKYYNPGKILSRLKRQLEKYEEQLAESESRMSELQLEMMDPELSADYERLMELQTKIDEENQTQESLLERMMETELELEEMETQDE